MAVQKNVEDSREDETPRAFDGAFSRRSKLRRRFLGYDRYAVDYLLSTLDTEAAAIDEELVQLRADLAALQTERATQDDLESILRNTIVSDALSKHARESAALLQTERVAGIDRDRIADMRD
jgi:hypothetical protein